MDDGERVLGTGRSGRVDPDPIVDVAITEPIRGRTAPFSTSRGRGAMGVHGDDERRFENAGGGFRGIADTAGASRPSTCARVGFPGVPRAASGGVG